MFRGHKGQLHVGDAGQRSPDKQLTRACGALQLVHDSQVRLISCRHVVMIANSAVEDTSGCDFGAWKAAVYLIFDGLMLPTSGRRSKV